MTRTGPGLVTVLVPAYNEAAEIEHCINAIAAQSVGAERIQLVVVDGDSDDGTAALAAAGGRVTRLPRCWCSTTRLDPLRPR